MALSVDAKQVLTGGIENMGILWDERPSVRRGVMSNLRREHPLFPKPLRMPAGLGLASLAAGALALAAVLVLAAVDKRPDASSTATPRFLTQLLGPTAPTPAHARVPCRGVSVHLRASGYTVKTATHEVAITPVGIGHSAWSSFRDGATRTTRYGHETIAVGRDSTEEFLTVTSNRAPPTWRWRLDTNGIRPTLATTGQSASPADFAFVRSRFSTAQAGR